MSDLFINRRILLVDDTRAIHEDIRKILPTEQSDDELGAFESELFDAAPARIETLFELDSAYQGQEGLRMLEKAKAEGRPYALAFVDMRMPPGWDGLTTVKHLWAADPALQIVICTAYSDCSWSTLAQELGRRDNLLVLKKPFDSIEVIQLAHALTERWSLRRAMEGRLSQLESELRLSERLATVGTLAAGVAHEINNPLTFVIANLDYVATSVQHLRTVCPEHGLVQELADAVEEARQGSERVRRIVGDMKKLSRADDQTLALVELQSVLEATLNLAGTDLRERARVRTNFRQVSPVQGNEARLGQVFLNLLINAIQAIPPGRAAENEIVVELGTDEANDVFVEIADTGSGIAPEVIPRIFDPFFTTKEPGMGTGLGLSICRSIITALGGRIQVKSTPGAGTTFRVTLASTVPPCRVLALDAVGSAA